MCDISGTHTGCCIGGLAVNIIAYADDIYLPLLGIQSLQMLIRRLEKCCSLFDLVCNTKKTVCMVFTPCDKEKFVSYSFPEFILNCQPLKYVSEFCYLGITNTLSDENDIHREICNMYIGANMLFRKLNKCSIT